MTDTTITLTPNAAGIAGPQPVQASAPLFTAGDLGRLVAIRTLANERTASTPYSVGTVFCANYNSVFRVYRVTGAGTTAAQNLAGTTPNYDQNAPRDVGLGIADGTAVLKYLGPGKQAWGWGQITQVIDSQNVIVDVDPRGPFASTVHSLRWRLGEWCPGRGYPRAVIFHQQRALWAGSVAKPQTLWASQSGDFENMGPDEPDGTVLDTDAITLTLDDDQLNTIKWMSPIPRGLCVGVPNGEFLVGPASTINAALAPTNIRAVRQGDRGSADVAGIRVSGVVLFVQRGARKLRQLEYDFASDSFSTADLTQLADHMCGPRPDGFVEMAFQEQPECTLWLVRADGRLATLTFDREQKVRAWATHTIGGGVTNPGTPAQDATLGGWVESVCVVPSPSGTTDDVYLVVVRSIGGVQVRTIEYLPAPFRAEIDGPTGGSFVDSGLSYNGAPVNHVAGLDHMDGFTVAICADGTDRGTAVVQNGQVAVPGAAASVIHVGQAYTSTLLTLPPETPGGQGGSIEGRQKRVKDVYLRLLESAGGLFGAPPHDGDLAALEGLDYYRDPGTLFTGDIRLPFPGGVDRQGQMLLLANAPLPMTLLAITYDLDTNA